MSDPFASPTSATAPSTSTPVRPARSTHRLSSHSVTTTHSLPLEDVPHIRGLSTPASPASSSFTSPFSDAHASLRTPSTPSRALPPSAYGDNDETRLGRKKSSTSIRRKPVPHHLDDIDLPTPSLPFSSNGHETPISRAGTPGTPVTPTRAPATYILPVDPPSYGHEQPLQHHQGLGSTLPPHDVAMMGIDTAVGADIISVEDLPRYAEQKETEPQTLARSLWKWGWLCPLLWAIGICILWIPLQPEQEEADAEKAQKMEEMIIILRETELRYARRCMWGFLAFLLVLVGVIALGVVLNKVL